jgi:glycosyltransferase involved in cell wall biosynthesis
MKIMLANKYFFNKGGAETVFFQERDFLIRSGIEVVDFSMQDERNEPSPYADSFVKNRDYHEDPASTLKKAATAFSMIHSLEAVSQIRKLIAKEKPDLLHCHNIYHQLTPSILRTAKMMGVPVVMTLHDTKVVCPTYSRMHEGNLCTACENGDFYNVVRQRCSEGSLARSALLYAEATYERFRGNYLCVDKVIAPSRFMADVVTRWRFPKDRVTVLYNGVNPHAFVPHAEEGRGYALYLGRLIREKGLVTLAEAQRRSGLRVVVAGTGPLEGLLSRGYPQLEMLGHLSGDELRTVIERAAFIVVPSINQENCPMSVLEAMAMGKPVVASRIGGIPELVSDGETGLLFEPGDADDLCIKMQAVASDLALRTRMGHAGRLRVETEFSLDSHNERLLEIYESVMTECCV